MNPNREREAAFYEVQQFRQRWLWTFLLFTSLFIVILFGYGMIKQLAFGQMWGNRPMSNTALAIVGMVVILFVVGLTYLFYTMKLITEVRNDELLVQFFPLSRQVISLESVRRCEVRTYNPIREYGGWGIRRVKSGKAYNVSGNRGVQLEFNSGKPLLIGSQKPEALERAIKMQL
jgi:hypothetical protein